MKIELTFQMYVIFILLVNNKFNIYIIELHKFILLSQNYPKHSLNLTV